MTVLLQGLLPGPISDPTKLLWTPPTQTAPVTVEPGESGFYSHTFGEAEDAIIKYPAAVREAQTELKKGRHLRTIGASLKMPSSGNCLLRYSNVSGSIYNEGILFNGNEKNVDAIDGAGTVSSPYVNLPDVYFQNCRVEAIVGKEASEVHADMYQPQAAMGNLYIDKFTGYSTYQGFYLQPESRPRGTVHMSRVNLGYKPYEGVTSSIILWFFGSESTPYNAYIGEEVYVEPREGQTLAKSVYPSEGVKNTKGELIGAFSEDGGNSVEFHSPYIHGKILKGPPPGGDFVTKASVGVGYTSPGYA